MGKYTFECDCRPGDVVYALEPKYDKNDIDIKVVPQKVDAIVSICFCGHDDEFYTYPAYYQGGHFEIGDTRCEGQSKSYFLTADEAKDERLRLLPILNGMKEYKYPWLKDQSKVAACADCGLEYGGDQSGFQDMLIPNDLWAMISPSGDSGGLLCPTCIVNRLSHIGKWYQTGMYVQRVAPELWGNGELVGNVLSINSDGE